MKPVSRTSEKNALRAHMKRALAAMTPEERALKSAAIVTRLLKRLALSPIKSILAYSSFGNEVDTRGIMTACVERGIQLLLPRLLPGSKTMQPILITDPARDLVPHPLGFLEPRADAPPLDPNFSIDLIIVPGLAFDDSGRRLGRGMGFYDRFLEAQKKSGAAKYALAFEAQIIDDVPVDAHDQSVDCIVTEGRIIVVP